MKRRTVGRLLMAAVLLVAVFLAWRFVRPMNIFVVSKAFERPISTVEVSVSTC